MPSSRGCDRRRAPGACLGAEVELVHADTALGGLVAAIERCDAVVNLAGEPLMGGRWTAARRAVLERQPHRGDRAAGAGHGRGQEPARASSFPGAPSAITATAVMNRSRKRPAAATIFWPGSAGGGRAPHRTPSRLGARVVLLRTGVVLGRAGGALAQMLPPFQFGVGGPVGSGTQYLPWIHLHDLVKIIAVALVDDRYRGPVNGVAPEQATSRSFARALGRALHRPAILPLPALALKAIFGEAATVLLASQRVDPRVLREHQFAFDFPTLDSALEDIVGGTAVEISPAQSRPEAAGEARYELRARTVIDAPLDQTFAFFSKAANLGVITPAAMSFSIQGQVPPMATGAMIDYRVRVGPLPVRWRTRITTWEPGRRFADLQEKGPYRFWWHEHTFQADGPRTVMEDRVYYTPPLGLFGRLANRVFIRSTLRKIFQYRGDVIRLRFGVS